MMDDFQFATKLKQGPKCDGAINSMPMIMDIGQLFSHLCKLSIGLLNVRVMVKIICITVKMLDAIQPDNTRNL